MAIVYFSTTGSNSYTYAQAQNPATPWASPSKANSSALDGDTLSFADGTYYFESVTFTKYFTFTATNLPTFFSPTCKVIFAGSSITDPCSWRFDSATISTVRGIKFKTAYNYDPGNSSYGNIYVRNGTVTFEQCDFTELAIFGGYDLGGIFMLQASGGLTLNNVRFYKNTRALGVGDPIGYGLICGAQNSTVNMTNCAIYNEATGSSSWQGLIRWNTGTLNITRTNVVIYSAGSTLGDVSSSGTTNMTNNYVNYYGLSSLYGTSSNCNVLSGNPFVDVTRDMYDPNTLTAGQQISKQGKPR